MELILRGSEYQDFLNCRKKWFYGWIEKLEPKRPDGKLFFGNLFHKWLEFYYQNGCNKLQADLLTSVWFNEQDTKEMEQTEIDDVKTLFAGVAEYYHHVYGETDSKWKVLGTEVEFIVRLEDDLFYTGTIDLVYETPEGKIRFADHKTVASLSMYEEKSKMDRQISRYWWVMDMFTKGIARVKWHETGLWEKWLQLEGKEIDGFDYNLIAKDYPKEPKVLKPKKGQTVGDLSQDKSQKTTYEKYLAKINELGHNPEDYNEMLEMLLNKPNLFLSRVDVLRGDEEKESAMWEFAHTAGDIHDVKLMIKEQPHMVEQLTYRNIGNQCSTMCQFQSLCRTTIEGGNVSLTKNLGYKRNEDR